jgi:hypothetical protein
MSIVVDFPGAVRAEQRHHLTRSDVEGDSVDGHGGAVALAQASELDAGIEGCGLGCWRHGPSVVEAGKPALGRRVTGRG